MNLASTEFRRGWRKVFDRFGTYQPILYVAAVLFVLGASALLTLGRYPAFAPRDQAGA